MKQKSELTDFCLYLYSNSDNYAGFVKTYVVSDKGMKKSYCQWRHLCMKWLLYKDNEIKKNAMTISLKLFIAKQRARITRINIYKLL